MGKEIKKGKKRFIITINLVLSILTLLICFVPMYILHGEDTLSSASILELCFENTIGVYKIKNSIVYIVILLMIGEMCLFNMRAFKNYNISYTIFDVLFSVIIIFIIAFTKPHGFNPTIDPILYVKTSLNVGNFVTFLIIILVKMGLNIYLLVKQYQIAKEYNAVYNDGETLEDNRTFSEKVEDVVEGVMETTQDALYGADQNFTEDIPATIQKSNGLRQINKVQTRRNIYKALFHDKSVLTILGITFITVVAFIILTIIF